MNREWHEIKLAPANEIVETKIDDEHGARNQALLKRQGSLWFFADGSMYVYYTPTHWRRPAPEQLEKLAREYEDKAKEHIKRAADLRKATGATS